MYKIHMLPSKLKERLFHQGYRFIGKHSAVKICEWTKKSIRNKGICYKGLFYGIKSWRCVQMTPSLGFCNLRCEWCWRDINFSKPDWNLSKEETDKPKEIIRNAILQQRELLIGYKGFGKVNKERFIEAMLPIHFAISLSGEPTLYPLLPELIKELHKERITSFVVSNGTNPEMLKEMLENKNTEPTQMYITLAAPDKEVFEKVTHPLKANLWEALISSLKILKRFKRPTIRITTTKGKNMENAEGYAELIKIANPAFVEVKAYMPIGFSRERLGYRFMPSHEEIVKFAREINKSIDYVLAAESKPSKVVLLWDNERERRINLEECIEAHKPDSEIIEKYMPATKTK
ncbi:MAG: 4-demethylwyosine synthase TYW1 [Candidatus Diapherotrites archaeon]|nr:4-demethylwyosine synthase TYW1 [Candidatus Diapherotrites archaeon]